MRKRKKRCLICKDFFDPIHRLGFRQITCLRNACQQKRKKQYDSSWHRRNRDLHNRMVADWFEGHREDRKIYMRRWRRAKTPCNKSSDIGQPNGSKREKGL